LNKNGDTNIPINKERHVKKLKNNNLKCTENQLLKNSVRHLIYDILVLYFHKKQL